MITGQFGDHLMTPDERAEMIRLCDAMAVEHDLTKILGVVQQLNALLDRAVIRKAETPPTWSDASNKVPQPVERMEPES